MRPVDPSIVLDSSIVKVSQILKPLPSSFQPPSIYYCHVSRAERKRNQKEAGVVACPVIQTNGRPDFEDVLRTRSPGEVVSGQLSVRTSSGITLVSILG